jgi:hypothetical protein
MSDTTDLVLEGALCQQCLEPIDDPLGFPGFPVLCAACKAALEEEEPDQ